MLAVSLKKILEIVTLKKLSGELNLNSIKVEIVLNFLSDLIFTLLNIN